MTRRDRCRWHRVGVRRPPHLVAAGLAVAALLALAAGGCGRAKKAADTTTTSTTLPTATAPASGTGTSGSASSGGEASLDEAPKVDPVLRPLPAPDAPLHVSVGSSGLADPATWPDACALLSDAQLRVLVPAAASVTTAGQFGRLFDGRPTPHPTTCTYRLAWTSPRDAAPGTVTVELRNVATAHTLDAVYRDRRSAASDLARDHPGLFADYGTKLAGASCFYDGRVLECLAGNYSFWVGGADPRSGAPGAGQRAEEWRNRVLAKVVVLLAERMTPSSAEAVSS